MVMDRSVVNHRAIPAPQHTLYTTMNDSSYGQLVAHQYNNIMVSQRTEIGQQTRSSVVHQDVVWFDVAVDHVVVVKVAQCLGNFTQPPLARGKVVVWAWNEVAEVAALLPIKQHEQVIVVTNPYGAPINCTTIARTMWVTTIHRTMWVTAIHRTVQVGSPQSAHHNPPYKLDHRNPPYKLGHRNPRTANLVTKKYRPYATPSVRPESRYRP